MVRAKKKFLDKRAAQTYQLAYTEGAGGSGGCAPPPPPFPLPSLPLLFSPLPPCTPRGEAPRASGGSALATGG